MTPSFLALLWSKACWAKKKKNRKMEHIPFSPNFLTIYTYKNNKFTFSTNVFSTAALIVDTVNTKTSIANPT